METSEHYEIKKVAVDYTLLNPEQWRWLLNNANDIEFNFVGVTLLIEKSVFNIINEL